MDAEKARGTIVLSSGIKDGDWFTLRSGTQSVTYEFDLSCGGDSRCVAGAAGGCGGTKLCVALPGGADGGSSDGGSETNCVDAAVAEGACRTDEVCIPVTTASSCGSGIAAVDAESSTGCSGDMKCVTPARGVSGLTDGCAGGNTCVASADLDDVVGAINGSTMGITAQRDGSTIALASVEEGISGNNAIAVSSDGGISATGMNGGAGCLFGASCARDQDCVSPNICKDGLCQVECNEMHDCYRYKSDYVNHYLACSQVHRCGSCTRIEDCPPYTENGYTYTYRCNTDGTCSVR